MEDVSEPTEARPSVVSTSGRYLPLVLLSAGIIALDQATKALATHDLETSPIELFNGALTLDYAQNTGAAFSIFRSGDVTLSVIAIVVCAGLIAYYQQTPTAPAATRVAIGLILGGALGNLIDRIRLGYVVDFIDLHWWPVFNLADSAIVIGVLLLALATWSLPSTRDL